MLKCETFVNELDGKTLKRIYSDKGFFILEKATETEYREAVISYSRSKDEFDETDRPINQE